jgi:hypothetical protein
MDLSMIFQLKLRLAIISDFRQISLAIEGLYGEY